CLLWLEPVQILSRENEPEDHVTEVAGIGVKRVDPVCEPDRIRVASQVTEVLHRHKAAVEELVEYRGALDERSQHLSASLSSAIQRSHEVGFIRDRDAAGLLQFIDVALIAEAVVNSLEFRLLNEVVHVLDLARGFLIGRLRATDLLHIRNEFGVQRTATKRRIVEPVCEVTAALKLGRLIKAG